MTHPHKLMVDKALELVESIGSDRGRGRAIGVPEATIRRWRTGEYGLPLRKTLGPLRAFLKRHGALEAGMDFGDGPGPVNQAVGDSHSGGMSPAEEAIAFMTAKAGMRRVAGEMTDKPMLVAFYTIALDDHWPLEEIKKLDAYRDAILGESGGPPE